MLFGHINKGNLDYCWDGFHQQGVMNPSVHIPVNSPHKPTSLAHQVLELVRAIIDSSLKRASTLSSQWTHHGPRAWQPADKHSPIGRPVYHTTKSLYPSDFRPTHAYISFQGYLSLKYILESNFHTLSTHLLSLQGQKSNLTLCTNLQQKILMFENPYVWIFKEKRTAFRMLKGKHYFLAEPITYGK